MYKNLRKYNKATIIYKLMPKLQSFYAITTKKQ